MATKQAVRRRQGRARISQTVVVRHGLDPKSHGFLDPRGPHAGDLPNIHMPSDVPYSVEYLIDDLALDESANSLLDSSGSAIVFHSGRDNYAADPAGKAGPRLACGRIERN